MAPKNFKVEIDSMIQLPDFPVTDANFPKSTTGNLSEGFLAGFWCGEEQFSCLQCAFDTLDKDHMLKHIKENHYEKF